MSKSSVLVIGLDGATWKVIDKLIKNGHLPFLAKIKRAGVSGNLKSTTPPLTAPAWTSFQTGTWPDQHKVFGFLNVIKDPLNPPFYNSRDIKQQKIWETLAENNLKSLVINMPVTYPVQKIKGILVSSFLTPLGAQFTHPKKVEKQLRNIGYKIDLLSKKDGGSEFLNKKVSEYQKDKLLDEIVDVAKKRADAFKLLFNKSFAFNFILFKESDLAQHYFWNSKRLAKFYDKLDLILKDLYEFYTSNGGKNLLVVSDHGFQKVGQYELSLYKWLQKKGFVNQDTNLVTDNFRAREFYAKFKRILPFFETFNIVRRRMIGKLEETARVKMLEDVKLRSEAEGIYFLDKSWLVKRDKLIKGLKQLKYRNKKVFAEVKLTRFGPDITWLFNKEFSLNYSPIASTVFNKRLAHISGDHVADINGIYLAKGPIKKQFKKKDHEIVDIFSIICKQLGVSVPKSAINLHDKEKKAEKVIRKAVEKFPGNWAIAFTGGKDSTVLLDLVARVAKTLPLVLFIDHELHFKQTYDFVSRFSKKRGFKVHYEAHEQALVKLQNEKEINKKKELSRILKIETIKDFVKKHKIETLLVGIRWDEHRARSEETYFSKRKNHTRVHPILHFSEENIWQYIEKYKLPYNPLYDLGYRSIGEEPFTNPVSKKNVAERAGREKDKEDIMQRLRSLGYF